MGRRKKGDVVNGWVCHDKPLEMGSTDAVSKVRRLFNAQKIYRFSIRWGVSTATLDREGEITGQSGVRPSVEAVKAALPAFVGEIDQVPPQYSAIKVDGQRAYDLARDGAEFELASRRVIIHEAAVTDAPDADDSY